MALAGLVFGDQTSSAAAHARAALVVTQAGACGSAEAHKIGRRHHVTVGSVCYTCGAFSISKDRSRRCGESEREHPMFAWDAHGSAAGLERREVLYQRELCIGQKIPTTHGHTGSCPAWRWITIARRLAAIRGRMGRVHGRRLQRQRGFGGLAPFQGADASADPNPVASTARG
jgi:hypothetical protein